MIPLLPSNNSLLPPLQSCGKLTIGGDTFVTAAGFEDRAFGSPGMISCNGDAQAIILNYAPKEARNRLKEMKLALESRGFSPQRIHILTYHRFQPQGFYDSFKSLLTELRVKRAFLDVSAMSKLAIILCLKAFQNSYCQLTVIYTEALDYAPSRKQYETARRNGRIHRPTLQIYTGVEGVLRVAELSSVAMQGQTTAAVVFMSFNEQLTQALINTVCPGRLFLINGRPPEFSWREAATAWIHDQLRAEWPQEDNPIEDGMPTRSTSTFDYRETVSLLQDLYWKLAFHHRVLLAPTGSKMQSLACFFAHALHPDIHIEYPTPKGFLPAYSKGCGRTWAVYFDDLGALIGRLQSLERQQRLGIDLSKTGISQARPI